MCSEKVLHGLLFKVVQNKCTDSQWENLRNAGTASRCVLVYIHESLPVNKSKSGFQKFIWDRHLSVLNIYSKYIHLVSTLMNQSLLGVLGWASRVSGSPQFLSITFACCHGLHRALLLTLINNKSFVWVLCQSEWPSLIFLAWSKTTKCHISALVSHFQIGLCIFLLMQLALLRGESQKFSMSTQETSPGDFRSSEQNSNGSKDLSFI